MAARLCRLTLTFSIANGAERAQCTSHWLSPSGLAQGDLATILEPEIDDWWTAQRALHTSAVVFQRSLLQTINITNGHVISGQDLSTASSAGNSSGDETLPAECAVVLSMRTALSGAKYRGRMYLPPYTSSCLDTAGNLGSTYIAPAADYWGALCVAVIAGAGDWVPVVYSRVDDAATPIERVECGSVIDVQRRRRRSLVETRYSFTF